MMREISVKFRCDTFEFGKLSSRNTAKVVMFNVVANIDGKNITPVSIVGISVFFFSVNKVFRNKVASQRMERESEI